MEVHTLDRKTVHKYVARREIGTYFLGNSPRMESSSSSTLDVR